MVIRIMKKIKHDKNKSTVKAVTPILYRPL